MKIIEIRSFLKIDIGKYESKEFHATASVEEGDNLNDVTTQLDDYVDWHARKPNRDAQLRQMQAQAKNEQSTPEQKAQAESWIAKYNERKARVEAM